MTVPNPFEYRTQPHCDCTARGSSFGLPAPTPRRNESPNKVLAQEKEGIR